MGWTTHAVTNQVPDLADYNLYAADTALQEAVAREGAQAAAPALSAYGRELGRARIIALAAEMDRAVPQLRAYDRQGRRTDDVVMHAGWHEFLHMGMAQGLHAPASVARAAAFLLHGQIEACTLCPLTMTSAAHVILARESWAEVLRAPLSGLEYDRADRPATEKRSMLIGMGLTEKQGGSDLRGTSTRAVRAEGDSGGYRLVGHKWFMSVPGADAHLVLAQLDGAPTCFYVPRWAPDGERNGVRVMQLKDKLGNRANASAEVEFHDAWGRLVAEPGRGIATLAEMAGYTRLDCALGSTALMRAALVQAMHHARHRLAFGRSLIRHTLMRSVLADLALETEAAVALGLRLARAVGLGEAGTAFDRALARIVTPAAKFWVCKRAITMVAEAMEALGGNGYVETYPLARLYREAPVNSIWEGSGNVMCLDVLRAVKKHPDLTQALFDRLRAEAGGGDLLKRIAALQNQLQQPAEELEAAARKVAADLVVLVQAVLLHRHAPPLVADAFLYSRLAAGARLGVAGMAVPAAYHATLLERAWGGEV